LSLVCPILTGNWRDVLLTDGADVVITDPPYGAKTHDSVPRTADREDGRAIGLRPSYECFTPDLVEEFVRSWSPRTRGWIVALTSHDLIPAWYEAYTSVGRYAFAPVPCVMRGMSVRLGGDGPSSWAIYAMVGRPRDLEFSNWGTLPGAYTGPADTRSAGGGRGKPEWLMRAIVRDYSRPGDLIVDPFAGWGATLSAAIGLGRQALGAEIDPAVAAEGNRRIARGCQTELFQ
jgi:site-specific DNA-methyltransferase (adenine-specific)